MSIFITVSDPVSVTVSTTVSEFCYHGKLVCIFTGCAVIASHLPGCLLRAPPLLPGSPGSYEPIVNLNLLDNDIINFLKSICSEIGERYCFEFDAIGCDGDHVHLFVGAEPKKFSFKSDADYKNITARKVFKEYPGIKKSFGMVNSRVIGIHWNSGRRNNIRCY